MKPLIYFSNNILFRGFFFLSLITLLANCKDDELPVSSNPLVGTWVMESIAISGCNDPEEDGSVSAICTTSTCSKIIMTREGAFTVSIILNNTPNEDTGTYLVMNDVIEICVQGGISCSNVVYELFDDNKRLKFTDVDGASGCTTETVYKKL